MTYLEQNVWSKIRDLFQWMKAYTTQPRKENQENCKLIYDVELFEAVIKIFEDWSSVEEVHGVCCIFDGAFLSGDRRSRLFVNLLLPTMLRSYLLRMGDTESVDGGVPKRPIKRNSNPVFTLGDFLPSSAAASDPLESLAFLLSRFCQLAPAFIRYPDLSDPPSGLPDIQVPSLYHKPPLKAPSKPFKTSGLPSNHVCLTTLKWNPSGISIATSSCTSDLDPACIVRIYMDTLMLQFAGGTEEQQKIVLISIRTFCDLVERLTELDKRRVLPYSHNHHPALLIEITLSIDKLIYILTFEFTLPAGSSDECERQMKQLKDRLLHDLLPRVERYATYRCFASVLLIVGAVRNVWKLGKVEASSTISVAPLYRRVRLSSDESLSEPSGEKPTITSMAAANRASMITNANFRAEPVAEDIPVSGGGDQLGDESCERNRQYLFHLRHQSNNDSVSASHLTVSGAYSHLRNHLHIFHHQQGTRDGLTGSSESLNLPPSESSQSLDADDKLYHRHFWSRSRPN